MGLRACEIVLTADGDLVPCDSRAVFLPGDRPIAADEIRLVHPKLASDDETVAVLKQLGIARVDPALELVAKVSRGGLDRWEPEDWELFWELVRRAGAERIAAVSSELGLSSEVVCARTKSGDWLPIEHDVLPGPIAREDDDSDATVVIDTAFHAKELKFLQRMGAVQGPVAGVGSEEEPWFASIERNSAMSLWTRSRRAGHDPVRITSSFSSPASPVPWAFFAI